VRLPEWTSEEGTGFSFDQLTPLSGCVVSYVYLCCISPIFVVSSFLFCCFPAPQTPVLSTFLRVLNLVEQQFVMDAFTPAQTTELVSRIGAKKARMRIDKMFINSFMGGALVSFGCALALSTNSSPWFQTNAPGLIRTISAMVFPVGLISKWSFSGFFPFLECFDR
jgi:Formate/nitrite transporter